MRSFAKLFAVLAVALVVVLNGALFDMSGARAAQYTGSPYHQDAVKVGKLPPVGERLPINPRLINLQAMGRKPGRHGGTWRMLIGKPKDIKLVPIYGYARLVGFNDKFELAADILASYEVVEGRIFTFHLRKGHKWSVRSYLFPQWSPGRSSICPGWGMVIRH